MGQSIARKRLPILLLIILAIVVAIACSVVAFLQNRTNTDTTDNGWRIVSGSRFPNVDIFTSPRPARKFVYWSGTLFIATAGGLFRIADKTITSQLTTADGLPSNDIRDAIVVSGNLFLATDDGLAIAEQSGHISILKNIYNRSANRINSIAFRGKDVAIATDGGIFTIRNTNVYSIIDSGKFVSICATNDGFIAAGYDESLYFVDSDAGIRLLHKVRGVNGLAYSSGKIIAATANGVILLSVGTEQSETLVTPQSFITATSGTMDSLWICGYHGADLFLHRRKTNSLPIPKSWGAVRDIYIEGDEVLLCGDGGVITADGCQFVANSPPENRITAICQHRQKLWVGTFSSGIASFDGTQWELPIVKLPSPFVNALATDGEHLYIATDHGLVVMNGFSKVLTRRDGLNSESISALFYDGENLWVATNRGMCVNRDFGWRQYYVSDGLCGDHIYGIAAKNDIVWVAAYGGVSRISVQRAECFQKADGALKNDWATAVAIGRDGIFVGTYGGGISQFDESERWTHHADDEIINPNAVAVAQGLPMFGTAGSGMLLWDGIRFSAITKEDGLPSNEILSIYVDGSYIWVGTTQGLAKIKADL